MGSSLAARRAGYIPKKRPSAVEIATTMSTFMGLITGGKGIIPAAILVKIKPRSIPMAPPISVITADSVRNCIRI